MTTDNAASATDQIGATGAELSPETEDLLEALRDVVDPELGVNVVDLGLVYGVTLDEDRVATIDMTLTSAACPLTDVIEDQTRVGARRSGQRLPDQLGLAAAVGPGQDHRGRPRAAARARLQRLTPGVIGVQSQRTAPAGFRLRFSCHDWHAAPSRPRRGPVVNRSAPRRGP